MITIILAAIAAILLGVCLGAAFFLFCIDG